MDLKGKFIIIKDILLRHKLSHLKEIPKNIPSFTKYFLLISLLILLDVIITKYILCLTTTTERTPVLAALFAFNSVIITGLGIIYQVEANNKREIRFKVHRQRKVRYERLLEQIKNDLSDVHIKKAIENTRLLNASQPITYDEKYNITKYSDFIFDLMLYGSPELIEKRIKQREIQIENDPNTSRLKTINSIANDTNMGKIRERNSMYNLITLYGLILQMRKEIGFEDRSISIRKLLALIFDNIYDPTFDQYFIDMNVPLY